MTQLGRAAASGSIVVMLGLFCFLFLFRLMPVDTAQFGQADLSKTETHTEAPMTQLGRATASSQVINHVWLISFPIFSFD